MRTSSGHLGMPQIDGGSPVPSSLPSLWTSKQLRGFKAMSQLVLWPGNANLCSLIDEEGGGFKDVNLGRSSQGEWI
jgi:hypothetical protein